MDMICFCNWLWNPTPRTLFVIVAPSVMATQKKSMYPAVAMAIPGGTKKATIATNEAPEEIPVPNPANKM